ncbi:flagellar basal-body MS-ring/collar protein FliF [Algihabitans albus]|uniref:flagellar basal-body MS-ring/collar protein FliF n=1 Tax=Algihabitans albus TaxID=2164067 RepID=UPI000E5CB822|nr:flagellar basal-body MS-ring/collar protein FliF [Algihabitans albus]
MNAFLETMRSLGPARLAIMAGVAAAILAFFVYFTGRLSQSEMALLYGELEQADSAQIVNTLESMGVDYQLSRDGSRVLVPEDQVARLRLSMAEQGLGTGGSIGYELFDGAEGFGTTSFEQNLRHKRAMEGELARSISSISSVNSARVHLVLPEREIFSRERRQPSASIVVSLSGNRGLSAQQIRAIQQLVSSAVPQMTSGAVSIVDDEGNLLARRSDGDGDDQLATTAEEMRINIENRLANAVESLLERSVGPGNVRAEVSVELDFDRVTENSEIYDPDSQVVRSTQTIEESSQDTEPGDAAVTVGNNLPDAGLQNPGALGTANSQSQRTEETVNYEISRVVKTHVRETGQIRRLSVAVLVNGQSVVGPEGEVTFEPYSPEKLEQLSALARSAVGYDANRGDTVEIANLPFADMVPNELGGTMADSFLGIDQQDLLRVAELIVLGVVAVLVLLLVVKPMVGRLLERGPAMAGDAGGILAGELAGQGGNLPALAGAGSGGGMMLAGDGQARSMLSGAGGSGAGGNVAVARETGLSMPDADENGAELEQLIDINRVDGRVRASSVRKIGEIVEKHPEEAVAIIRTWLYQEA